MRIQASNPTLLAVHLQTPAARPSTGALDSMERVRPAAAWLVAIGVGSPVQRPAAPLAHHAPVPIVGQPGDWPGYGRAVAGRLVGDEARRRAIHLDGGDPWTAPGDRSERITVGWALQKDDRLQYDVDRKVFFVTDTEGGRRDVASLDEVRDVAAKNGGIAQGNGAGFDAVGRFVSGRVDEPGTPRAAGPQPGTGSDTSALLQRFFETVLGLFSKLFGGR